MSTRDGWDVAYRERGDASMWGDDPIPILSDTINMLRERDIRTVVDLGCGDGRNLDGLAQAGFLCAGMDSSPTALANATRRLQGRAMLLQLDIHDLACLSPGSLDAVTCFDVFGQLEEPERMLESVRTVLRPGGLFVVNAFTTDDSEFGVGDPVGPRSFLYRDTLFRFFLRDEIEDLFAAWHVERIDQQSWVDPPHGDFRPYEHTHDNWIVVATP